MEKLVCPYCKEPLDSIENRHSSWLEWSLINDVYTWNDPWDPGSFYCEHCDATLDDSFIKEAVSFANDE